jgi:hypothetical protein
MAATAQNPLYLNRFYTGISGGPGLGNKIGQLRIGHDFRSVGMGQKCNNATNAFENGPGGYSIP